MFTTHQEHPRLSPNGLSCGVTQASGCWGRRHVCPIYGGMDLPVSTSRDGDAAPAGLQLLWQSISWVGQHPPRMAKIPPDFSQVGRSVRCFCPPQEPPVEEESRVAPADKMGLAETWKENPAGRRVPAS